MEGEEAIVSQGHPSDFVVEMEVEVVVEEVVMAELRVGELGGREFRGLIKGALAGWLKIPASQIYTSHSRDASREPPPCALSSSF